MYLYISKYIFHFLSSFLIKFLTLYTIIIIIMIINESIISIRYVYQIRVFAIVLVLFKKVQSIKIIRNHIVLKKNDIIFRKL